MKASIATFAAFAAIAVVHTVYLAVVSNTRYRRTIEIPYPRPLLSPQQRAAAACWEIVDGGRPLPCGFAPPEGFPFPPGPSARGAGGGRARDATMAPWGIVDAMRPLAHDEGGAIASAVRNATRGRTEFYFLPASLALYRRAFRGAHNVIPAVLSIVFLLAFLALLPVYALHPRRASAPANLNVFPALLLLLLPLTAFYYNAFPSIYYASLNLPPYAPLRTTSKQTARVADAFLAASNGISVPLAHAILSLALAASRRRRGEGVGVCMAVEGLVVLVVTGGGIALYFAAYYRVTFRLAEVPFVSLPAFLYAFRGFRVWPYYRRQIVAAALHTAYAAVMYAILIAQLTLASMKRKQAGTQTTNRQQTTHHPPPPQPTAAPDSQQGQRTEPPPPFLIPPQCFSFLRALVASFLPLQALLALAEALATPAGNVTTFAMGIPGTRVWLRATLGRPVSVGGSWLLGGLTAAVFVEAAVTGGWRR